MSNRPGAAGLAALSLCESLLLSLTENGIIDIAEAKGILADAAAMHRGAASTADGSAGDHAEAAALLEAIRLDGHALRRAQPTPAPNGQGGHPNGLDAPTLKAKARRG